MHQNFDGPLRKWWFESLVFLKQDFLEAVWGCDEQFRLLSHCQRAFSTSKSASAQNFLPSRGVESFGGAPGADFSAIGHFGTKGNKLMPKSCRKHQGDIGETSGNAGGKALAGKI